MKELFDFRRENKFELITRGTLIAILKAIFLESMFCHQIICN